MIDIEDTWRKADEAQVQMVLTRQRKELQRLEEMLNYIEERYYKLKSERREVDVRPQPTGRVP